MTDILDLEGWTPTNKHTDGDEYVIEAEYTKQRDRFQTVTVLGDPEGIRDLYWQLTKNYTCSDGTGIGDVRVINLDGDDVTMYVMTNPSDNATRLSNLNG